MEMPEAESFLKNHRLRIVAGVRNVESLVEFLTQPVDGKGSFLSTEMASKITAKGTNEEKMREVYKHLNCTRGYELMLTCLKKEEPDLIEDLEMRQTGSKAPARKRFRSSEDADVVDKTDLNKPSLKTFSTLAQLERWVSDPDNSKDLIDKLEKRIKTKGLEALKEQLENMKLRKELCFTANKVRTIKKNTNLSVFFQNPTNAEFPEVAIEIFFLKKGKNDFMREKDKQNDSGRHSDRGYSSHNNNLKIDPDNNPLSDSAALKGMEDKVAQHNELNMSETKLVDINGQHLHSAQGLNGTNDPTQTGREDYKSLDKTTGEMQETGYKPSMHQSEPFQSTTAGTEGEVRQIGSGVQMQNEGDTALGKRMDMLEPGVPTPENDLAQKKKECKKTRNLNDSKRKKILEQRNLLYAWAEKKCSREESVENDVEDVFGHMSFENIVEHREYPCFTAEDIMIYTDPQTQERQIIYIDKENSAEKDLTTDTEVRVSYQMGVCGIKHAVIIMNQGEKEVRDDTFDSILKCCEGLVFEAFAPALAVFKNLQRQEKFFSLIENH